MFRLFDRATCDIGVDLGSATTLLYCVNQGVVLAEPSVVAFDRKSKRLVAAGEEAGQLLGRTPANIILVRPLRKGVVTDFDAAAQMLQHFVRQAINGATPGRMIIGIPSDTTGVERQAVVETALQAGAKSVHLVEDTLAAAIGSGLPVTDPVGSMIVDIGGGKTEVAMLCSQGLVVFQTLRLGGDALNDCIVHHLRKNHELLISEHIAEQIKVEIAAAVEMKDDINLEVCGQDMLSGLPRTLDVHAAEIRDCIAEPLQAIVRAVKQTLALSPPQLVADVYRRGIMLSGGGALLRGLDTLITEETQIAVHIAESPHDCVAVGTGKILQDFKDLSRVLTA